MSYFPMYIPLEQARCLIVGGGSVALRKAQVLLDFEAKVTVVAPRIHDRLRVHPQVICLMREFQVQDLENQKLVVAATDDKKLNHDISVLCRQRNIPVNAVDQTKDCTFLFPAYVKQGPVTAAVTSGGTSPVVAQYVKRQIENAIGQNLGELSRHLGEVRPYVKQALGTEAQRKQVYEGLLKTGLLQGDFCQADVERMIKEVKDGDCNRNQRVEIGDGPGQPGL